MDATQLPVTAAQGLAPPPAPAQEKKDALSIDSVIGNIGKGVEEADKKVKAYEVEAGKLGKPPIPTLPPKPKVENTDPVSAWGSIAMVFAALASSRVRNHATTAMNAASAALNGIKQGDKEAADQKFKEWEIETKNALELGRFQSDAYKELMDSVHHKETLAMEEGRQVDAATEGKFRALTTALQDPEMWTTLQRGGLAGAAGLQKQRDKVAQDYKEKQLELSKQYNVYLARQNLQTDPNYLAAGPVEKANMMAEVTKPLMQASNSGRGYITYTPEQVDKNSSSMANLDQPMFSDSIIAHSASAEETNERAREKAKLRGFNLSNASYDELKKQETNATSGVDGKAIRSLTTVKQHLDLMDALIGKLPDPSDTKAFNWAVISLARQVSDEHVSDFDTARQVVVNEVLKAVSGTGASMAESDRRELEDVFNPSKSKEALYHVSHTLKELTAGQIQGLAQQYSKFKPASEVMPISANTLRAMFINPDTGQIEKSLVRWDDERIKALMEGKPEPPMPPIKGSKTLRANGKADQIWYLSNGQRVYESDGQPVAE